MGRPQIGWRTLGIRDRILVPRPAASMTAVSDWLKPLGKANSSLPALPPTLRGVHRPEKAGATQPVLVEPCQTRDQRPPGQTRTGRAAHRRETLRGVTTV